MNETIIAWTDLTLNIASGCSKPAAVPEHMQTIAEEEYGGPIEPRWCKHGSSPECVHCYAETLSLKRGWSTKPWSEQNASENIKLRPERIAEVYRIKPSDKLAPPSVRTKIFCGSMFDIGHREIPEKMLRDLWTALVRRDDLIIQLLTKRPDRFERWPGPWPDHIWLGTTCGHPVTKWRIEMLRRSPAKVRFVSIEPLLASMNAPKRLNLEGIDWVIVGGESGPNFRPMDMEWAREIRDICKDTGTAYFFKQDAAFVTETRCYLVEKDGQCMQYRQFPGELTPPKHVPPQNEKTHLKLYPSKPTPIPQTTLF